MPAPRFIKAAVGERGKKSESRIQEWLAAFDEAHIDFDWYRFPDARAAGGRAQAAPADYEWFYHGHFGLIEVKELAHDFRLPAKNVKLHQISRAKKRIKAGGQAHMIVHHTTTGMWRLVPMEFFFNKVDQPSWDLSPFECYDNYRRLMEDLIVMQIKTGCIG